MSKVGWTTSAALLALALTGCQHGQGPEAGGTTTARAEQTQGTMAQGQGGMMQGQGGMMHGGPGMHGQGMMQGEPMASACPMMSQGAQVTEENIDGGVALVFTTTDPSRVDMLRAHVQRMATMPGWSGQGRGPMAMPPSTATAVDIPNGARLELRARDPNDVTALRERAQYRTAHMRSGQCPMMQASAGQQPPPG